MAATHHSALLPGFVRSRSALVAICYEELLAQPVGTTDKGIGAPTFTEIAVVLSVRLERDSRGLVERIIQEFGLETIDLGPRHWRWPTVRSFDSARDAVRRS